MALQDYKSTVSAKVSSEDVFSKIARVSEWWSKGFTVTGR
jgi:hypothetical protein